MYFHCWDLARGKGIANGHAGVSIAGRVEYDVIDTVIGSPVDRLYQGALAVVLQVRQIVTARTGKTGEVLHDFLEGAVPIGARLSAAEQIKIGSIENQDTGHGTSSSPPRGKSARSC